MEIIDQGPATIDFASLLGALIELCVISANYHPESDYSERLPGRISTFSELQEIIEARAASFLEAEEVSEVQTLLKLTKFYLLEPDMDENDAGNYEKQKIIPNLPAFEHVLDTVFIEEHQDIFLYSPLPSYIVEMIQSIIFIDLETLSDIVEVLTKLLESETNFFRNSIPLVLRVAQFLQKDLYNLPTHVISLLSARWGPNHRERKIKSPQQVIPEYLNKKHVYFFVHDFISITKNFFSVSVESVGLIRDMQQAYFDRHSIITIHDVPWLK